MHSTLSISKRQVRKSTADILSMIKEYEESGYTIAEYCQVNGLKASTFHYWLSKYRKKDKLSSPQADFIPVSIHQSGNDLHAEAVLFAEVRGIKIYQPVSTEFLLALLSH